jgi:hypothetical protein
MAEEVEHSRYGRGFVRKERYAGGEFFVEFDNGLKLWVKRKDLSFSPKNEPIKIDSPKKTQQSGSKPSQLPSKPIPHIHPTIICLDPELQDKYGVDEGADGVPQRGGDKIESPGDNAQKGDSRDNKSPFDLESRIIIESLRLGGVPHNLASRFTAGREREIEIVQSFFSDRGKGAVLLEGEYGVGKSHMLELITSMALQKGWAVAKIEIDPKETAFHRPKALYQAITRSFIYTKNGQVHNFYEFIRDVATTSNIHSLKKLFSHTYFKEVLIRWEENDDNYGLIEWIAGDGIEGQYSKIPKLHEAQTMPKLHEAQTATNIYCNIISGIGWAAKNVLNLEGILILIDEAEGIDPAWYTSYQYGKALNFVKGITLMVQNNPDLRLEPNKYIYTQEVPRSKVGKLTGLNYCGLDRDIVPFLWESESHVKIIYSFVPDLLGTIVDIESKMPWFTEIPRINLENIDSKAMDKLYSKLFDIYSNAYQFIPHIDTRAYLPTTKTRLFVKGIIESFDLQRFDKNIDFEQFSAL